jgi:cytochrome P450
MEAFTVEPMDKFLIFLKDDEWKNVRSIVSGTFTSGKLKTVHNSIF